MKEEKRLQNLIIHLENTVDTLRKLRILDSKKIEELQKELEDARTMEGI